MTWPGATRLTGRSAAGSSSSTGRRTGASGARAVNKEPHPVTGSAVVLTLARVWDKAPENSSLLNLAALCQRCRNRWNAADRAQSRMRRRLANVLRAGQLPLPWPPGVSAAMDLYALLVQAGQIAPPVIQMAIPREAWEYVA